MTTLELASELRGVVNLFAAAAQALLEGDLGQFKVKFGQALRALDAYQDLQSQCCL
jgi:hypothetical protein